MTTILERYEELHPASWRLHERAARYFPDGVTHDIRYFQPFPLYVERNVLASQRVFEAAARDGVRVVFSSSSSVYGATFSANTAARIIRMTITAPTVPSGRRRMKSPVARRIRRQVVSSR